MDELKLIPYTGEIVPLDASPDGMSVAARTPQPTDKDTGLVPYSGKIIPLNTQQDSAVTSAIGPAEATMGVADVKAKEIKDADLLKKQSEISTHLKGDYDPSGVFEKASDYPLSIDIGRSEDLGAKRAKFKEVYPKGNLKVVGTSQGSVVLAKRGPDDKYQELSSIPSTISSVASEPVVGAALGSWLLGPIGAAAGAGTGNAIKQKIEMGRGYQKEYNPSEAITEGLGAGAAEFGGKYIAKYLGLAAHTVQNQEVADAVKAGYDEALKPLAIGQTSTGFLGPLLRGSFGQVSKTSPKVQALVDAQQKSLLDSVKNQVNQGISLNGMSDDSLASAIAAQKRELSNILTPAGIRRPDAGTALQEGLNIYKETTGGLARHLYDKVQEAAPDISFDLSSAKNVARDILAGVKSHASGPASDIPTIQVAQMPKGDFADGLKALQNVTPLLKDTIKVGADGKPILDSNGKAIAVSAYDQLAALRSRFFDLRFTDDPNTNRMATNVWRSLSEAMENPKPAITPPLATDFVPTSPTLEAAKDAKNKAFVAAKNEANDLWRAREDALEKSYVAGALRSDTPESLAARYFKPGNATALSTIKDLVPETQWNDFRKGFTTDILNSPSAQSGLTRLRNFEAIDPDGFNMLMTPSEKGLAEDYLRQSAKFEHSPLNQIMNKNMTESERSIALIKGGSAKDVEDMVRLAGGAASPMAQGLKAGIFKDILDNATVVNSGGREVMDPDKLINVIQGWKKSGHLDALMTPGDWARIENWQKYASHVNPVNDGGGGFQAGAVRSQLTEAPVNIVMGKGESVVKRLVFPLLGNNRMAWFLTRERVPIRLAQNPDAENLIRASTAALQAMRGDAGRFEENKKPGTVAAVGSWINDVTSPRAANRAASNAGLPTAP